MKKKLDVLKLFFKDISKIQQIKQVILYAVRFGDLESIKFIIESVKKTIDIGFCLPTASSSGRLEIMKYLIEECGIDLFSLDERLERNCLHNAVKVQHFEIVKYLIDLKKSTTTTTTTPVFSPST